MVPWDSKVIPQHICGSLFTVFIIVGFLVCPPLLPMFYPSLLQLFYPHPCTFCWRQWPCCTLWIWLCCPHWYLDWWHKGIIFLGYPTLHTKSTPFLLIFLYGGFRSIPVPYDFLSMWRSHLLCHTSENWRYEQIYILRTTKGSPWQFLSGHPFTHLHSFWWGFI